MWCDSGTGGVIHRLLINMEELLGSPRYRSNDSVREQIDGDYAIANGEPTLPVEDDDDGSDAVAARRPSFSDNDREVRRVNVPGHKSSTASGSTSPSPAVSPLPSDSSSSSSDSSAPELRAPFLPASHSCGPLRPLNEGQAAWAAAQGEIVAQMVADWNHMGAVWAATVNTTTMNQSRRSSQSSVMPTPRAMNAALPSMPASARRGSGIGAGPNVAAVLNGPSSHHRHSSSSSSNDSSLPPSLPTSLSNSVLSTPRDPPPHPTSVPPSLASTTGSRPLSELPSLPHSTVASGATTPFNGIDVGAGTLMMNALAAGRILRDSSGSRRGSVIQFNGIEKDVGQISYLAGQAKSVQLLYAELQRSECEKEMLKQQLATAQKQLQLLQAAATIDPSSSVPEESKQHHDGEQLETIDTLRSQRFDLLNEEIEAARVQAYQALEREIEQERKKRLMTLAAEERTTTNNTETN